MIPKKQSMRKEEKLQNQAVSVEAGKKQQPTSFSPF